MFKNVIEENVLHYISGRFYFVPAGRPNPFNEVIHSETIMNLTRKLSFEIVHHSSRL